MKMLKRIGLAGVAALLTGGCMGLVGNPERAGDQLLFDAAGGAGWRNHVKVVSDPIGGSGSVLQGERVAKDSCQMTFTKKGGFFAVPGDFSGAVVLRALVKEEGHVRVALVSGSKLKSYYPPLPETNGWCDLVLPLAQAQGKLAAGDSIDDITVWLFSNQKGSALSTNARIYLDRAVFRPVAAGEDK